MGGNCVRDVVARIPTKERVPITGFIPSEGFGARERIDQRGGEAERCLIEAKILIRRPFLLETIEGETEVEDESRRECRQVVGHKCVVEALER